jgi:LPXTG-motif cell wall-anchored protein
VTDENGLAVFELTYGKYTYQEYEAPEGYVIDETCFPFEITENGQIVKAVMTNKAIEDTPEPETEGKDTPKTTTGTPKTGDNMPIALYLGLLGLSAAGIGAGAYFSRKKKRNKLKQ